MNAATLPADDTPAMTPETGARLGARPGSVLALDDPLEQATFTRWLEAEGGRRLGESNLQLAGMHCAACAGLIESALMAVPGVCDARVAAASQRAVVTWDPQRTRPSQLIEAVRRAGYDAVPDAAAPARALRQREARAALWRLFVAAFCAMQVMMLAAPAYFAPAGDLTPDLKRLLDWGAWLLTLPVLAFSCGPFFGGAWRSVRQRRIGMDVPVALGIAITFVASSGATFEPGGWFGHEVYFDSLTMFVSFLLASRYLEMRVRHRAAEELEAGMARLPETAERVLDDGSSETVSVLRLRPGDRACVPLGESIPADGLLLEGATRCDEALLSGEAVPVEKRAGDPLVGGSINVGAPVLMRVLRVGADTRLAGIQAMMRSAAAERPALARLADRWAGPFLWSVLLLAAAGAAAWSFIDPARALWVAVSVLVVTCPCALSLAAPATLLAAVRALARRGITVQRLDAVEALARADHFFFDKTGTLTTDRPSFGEARLTPAGERAFSEEAAQASRVGSKALAIAAALARHSRHPLSQAVVHAHDAWVSSTAEADLSAGPRLESIAEHAGQGLSASDGAGHEWRLGAVNWVTPSGVGTVVPEDAEARLGLARDGVLLATFSFAEALRPGAAGVVSALRAEGLRVTLLSGDRPERARALAERLGITDVIAGASPQDKLDAVSAAQAAGRCVAMVGDGVNDAPVLARADVAVAMGQGALVARAGAGAVLASGRPADLLHARHVGQRAMRIVRQNLAWAAAYNATCVPLALAGWLPPWAAGLGMAASSLFVVVNAARLAR